MKVMMKSTSENQMPYLKVETEVSAKYRGAFCEATVKGVDLCVKCKVTFKDVKLGTKQVDHTAIRGGIESVQLNADVEVYASAISGSSCDADISGLSSDPGGSSKRSNELFFKGMIVRITDASLYSVEFNDGDKRTLRRSQLVPMGEKHFEESSTLDQLPLHNPEQFGTPVINRRRPRTIRTKDGSVPSQSADDSGSESGQSSSGLRIMKYPRRLTKLVGKLVRVTVQDATTAAANLKGIPCLVVVPSAYPNLEVRQNQLMIRSYRDNKFYVVGTRTVDVVTREALVKDANASSDKNFINAVERALMWLDSHELPHSWSDRETLFGTQSIGGESEEGSGESSDSECGSTTQEQKDHWLAMLFNFMDSIGSPINKVPTVANKDLDLYRLARIVRRLGGSQRVSREMKWPLVSSKMQLPATSAHASLRAAYSRYLQQFEDFNRKLGSESMSFPSSGRRSSTTPRTSTSSLNPRERRASQSSESQSVADASGIPVTPVSSGHKRKMSTSKDDASTTHASGTSSEMHQPPGHVGGAKEKRPKTLSIDPKMPSVPLPSPSEGAVGSKAAKKKGLRQHTPSESMSRRSLRTESMDLYDEKPKEKMRVKEEKLKDKEKKERQGEKAGLETMSYSLDSHFEKERTRSKEYRHVIRSRRQLDAMVPMVGTEVLVKCLEGGKSKVYEARITQSENRGEFPRYNVHYKGWKKRYDEWIEKSRIVGVICGSTPDQADARNDFGSEDRTGSDQEGSTGRKSPDDFTQPEPGVSGRVSAREKRKSLELDEDVEEKAVELKYEKFSSERLRDTEAREIRLKRRRRHDTKSSHSERDKEEEEEEGRGEEKVKAVEDETDEAQEVEEFEEDTTTQKSSNVKRRRMSKKDPLSRRSKRYLERQLSRDTIESTVTSASKSTNDSESAVVKGEPTSDEEEEEEVEPPPPVSHEETVRTRKRSKVEEERESKSDDETIVDKQEDTSVEAEESSQYSKRGETKRSRDLARGLASRDEASPVRTRGRRRLDSNKSSSGSRPSKRLRREIPILERVVSSSVSSPSGMAADDSYDSDSALPNMRVTREKRRGAEACGRRLDVLSCQEEVVSLAKTDNPSTPSTDGMRDDKENTCIDENEEADGEDDITGEDDEESTEEEDLESRITGEDIEEDMDDDNEEEEEEEEEEEIEQSTVGTDDYEEIEDRSADTIIPLQESSTDEASSSVAEGSQTGRRRARHAKNNQTLSYSRNRRRTVSNASVSSKEPAEPPPISPELPPPSLSRLRPFVRPTPSFIPTNLDQVESYEERERILVDSIKACQQRWREVKQEMRDLDREDAQRRAKRRRRKLSQQPPVLSAVYPPPNPSLPRSAATTPDSAPPVVIASST